MKMKSNNLKKKKWMRNNCLFSWCCCEERRRRRRRVRYTRSIGGEWEIKVAVNAVQSHEWISLCFLLSQEFQCRVFKGFFFVRWRERIYISDLCFLLKYREIKKNANFFYLKIKKMLTCLPWYIDFLS
jgi:hypothetical protein